MVEFLDVVDESDEVVETLERSKIQPHHIRRNAIVILQDSQKNLILQLRSKNKSMYPDCYDASACGMVRAGETYAEAAARELLEETGLKCELKHVTTVRRDVPMSDGSVMPLFSGLFFGVTDETEFTPHPEEVQKIEKFSVSQVLEKAKGDDSQFPHYLAEDIEFVQDHLL